MLTIHSLAKALGFDTVALGPELHAEALQAVLDPMGGVMSGKLAVGSGLEFCKWSQTMGKKR